MRETSEACSTNGGCCTMTCVMPARSMLNVPSGCPAAASASSILAFIKFTGTVEGTGATVVRADRARVGARPRDVRAPRAAASVLRLFDLRASRQYLGVEHPEHHASIAEHLFIVALQGLGPRLAVTFGDD